MTTSDQTKNRGPATLKTAVPFVIATVALAVFLNPVIAAALVGASALCLMFNIEYWLRRSVVAQERLVVAQERLAEAAEVERR
jgi:hypothetical protein